MGLFKEYAFLRKLVDIWCLRLGMSPETTDPVIQVVDGDEQNVGPVDRVGGSGALLRHNENDEKCNRIEERSGTRQEFRYSTWATFLARSAAVRPRVLTTSATEHGGNSEIHFDSGVFCLAGSIQLR